MLVVCEMTVPLDFALTLGNRQVIIIPFGRLDIEEISALTGPERS